MFNRTLSMYTSVTEAIFWLEKDPDQSAVVYVVLHDPLYMFWLPNSIYTDLFRHMVEGCRSQPMPVRWSRNVQQDWEGGLRLVPGVEHGYVRDVASKGHLPVVKVVQGSLRSHDLVILHL